MVERRESREVEALAGEAGLGAPHLYIAMKREARADSQLALPPAAGGRAPLEDEGVRLTFDRRDTGPLATMGLDRPPTAVASSPIVCRGESHRAVSVPQGATG